MTIDEYFAQEEYFSESAQAFMDIDEMAWMRAYYSFRKLMSVFPEEFPHTVLWQKFDQKLSPPAAELIVQLYAHGSVSCAYKVFGDISGITREQARKRLQYAAKALGVSVTTHDTQWESNGGNFITAQIVTPGLVVRVNGAVLA